MSDVSTPKDPITSAMEKGIEEAAKVAKEYLDKLIVPGLEQGGGIIGDTMAYWRFKNQINLVLKAKKFLESKGIEPQAVLPTVVAPLLEAGSLEGDENMQERWATLLSSAAANPSSVPPSFPRILAELSSKEAQILEWMADRVKQEVGWVATWEEIHEAHQMATWDYEVLMGNLVRLNLCRPSSISYFLDETGAKKSTEWLSYQQVEFTRLGMAFVRACRMPT